MADERVLEGVASDLPDNLQRFVRFEQHNLWKPEKFRDPERISEMEARYLPEGGASFRLPCFRVPRTSCYVYGCETGTGLWSGIASGGDPAGWLLFPVHPGELRHYSDYLSGVRARDAAEDGVWLWATPTSSTRTLLAWPDGRPEEAFFTKLSLHTRLFGDRRLTRRKVAVSVGLSNFIRDCTRDLPCGIRYLPEPLGLVPRVIQDRGTVYRALPDEVRNGKVVLAPLFALIGGNGRYRPIMLEIMQREGAGALEILKTVLLERFSRLWVDLVFDFGIILEAHGQDLLLALSDDSIPLGDFYYRDFEGLTVDWALRRARGLPEPSLPYSFEWYLAYETWGYPLFQLVSHKMLISLFDYLHLVLVDIECSVREWQASGAVAGDSLAAGELTLLFSRYLRKAIHDKFGMKEAIEYNVIQPNLSRFGKFLMQVRHEVMHTGAGRC